MHSLIMLVGGTFLLASSALNIFTYIEYRRVKALYFLVPLLIITLGYFIFCLILYIKVKRIKEAWHKYNDLDLLKLTKRMIKLLPPFASITREYNNWR